MLSDKEFDAIRDGGKTETLMVGDTLYTTKPVFDPRSPDPQMTPLSVAGLAGLIEYTKAHPGHAAEAIAHVVNFQTVHLLSGTVGRFWQRQTFAVACVPLPEGLRFGQYADLETFNVQLQSLFVPNDDRSRVLSVVGKVSEVLTSVVDDDGATQTVAVKSGIVREGRETSPNPVVLAPYRTFRELAQPESSFVLRLRAGTPPSAALFEADGGAWKLEAVNRIKAWLNENLPESIPVIG